jgi:hypothetical protein
MVVAAALMVLSAAVGAGLFAYRAAFTDRIYPGVSVQGLDVGGLTLDEATTALAEHLPAPAVEGIGLRAGEHFWRLTWADVGQGYDYAGTAQVAFQIAREGSPSENLLSPWRVRFAGRAVEPLAIPPDPAQVEARLEEAASFMYVPPAEAKLRITPEGLAPSPGRPGTALDVEASTARVLQALGDGTAEVSLALTDILPTLSEPEPAYSQARSLLAQSFTLIAYDPLTDYHTEFKAPPPRVATWLQAVPDPASEGDRLVLGGDQTPVRAWLREIEVQLGPERTMDEPETMARILEALVAGEPRAEARIRHPQSTYVVQPGDNLFDIAYSHGFPAWRLEEANPDVDPDALAIGMELALPSIDVLFPEPLVPGKRIEINLPEQRLRAYEGEQLVFDFTCSSGISSTPTIAGQFQVLFKEPEAYASRWDLEMPYYMAVYQEGPEFFNGIHELPITSSGRRLWSGVLGWPASYGCIILDIGDAEALYNWAPVGTLVRITGVAPGTPVYKEEEGEIEQTEQAEQPQQQ